MQALTTKTSLVPTIMTLFDTCLGFQTNNVTINIWHHILVTAFELLDATTNH